MYATQLTLIHLIMSMRKFDTIELLVHCFVYSKLVFFYKLSSKAQIELPVYALCFRAEKGFGDCFQYRNLVGNYFGCSLDGASLRYVRVAKQISLRHVLLKNKTLIRRSYKNELLLSISQASNKNSHLAAPAGLNQYIILKLFAISVNFRIPPFMQNPFSLWICRRHYQVFCWCLQKL